MLKGRGEPSEVISLKLLLETVDILLNLYKNFSGSLLNFLVTMADKDKRGDCPTPHTGRQEAPGTQEAQDTSGAQYATRTQDAPGAQDTPGAQHAPGAQNAPRTHFSSDSRELDDHSDISRRNRQDARRGSSASEFSAQNIKSAQDISSIQDVRSAQDTRSRQGVASAQDVRSRHDVRPAQDVRSRQDVRSAQDVRSRQGIRSEQDVKSRHDVRSAQDVRSEQDARSTHDVRSRHDVRRVSDVRSRQDVRSTRDVRSLHDVRSAQDVRSARDVRSAEDLVSSQDNAGASMLAAWRGFANLDLTCTDASADRMGPNQSRPDIYDRSSNVSFNELPVPTRDSNTISPINIHSDRAVLSDVRELSEMTSMGGGDAQSASYQSPHLRCPTLRAHAATHTYTRRSPTHGPVFYDSTGRVWRLDPDSTFIYEDLGMPYEPVIGATSGWRDDHVYAPWDPRPATCGWRDDAVYDPLDRRPAECERRDEEMSVAMDPCRVYGRYIPRSYACTLRTYHMTQDIASLCGTLVYSCVRSA